MRSFLSCLAATAVLLVASPDAWADVADLEKDLQASLEQSRKQVSLAARKLERGLDASPEIARIRTLAENIRITHLLLEERFKFREEKAKALGSEVLSRQQAMAEGYKAALTEYLALIDNLPSVARGQRSAVSDQLESTNNLKTLLDKLLPKKKRPLIGSLPYKHLNYPPAEPSSAPTIAPAYHGGDKTVVLDDTKDTPEAPITKEIAALAQTLSWSPVSIYEYVKNNIETEWYWGCMKGAEETLHQKSGNDCDQATLLTALLRASGYPTRYVRGSVEFIAGGNDKPIDRIRNLFGIDDPANIARFLQKAGIPFKPIISGGGIANFQIEHIWVESQIPYANYRGAIIDALGKTWLGLDTSIKVKGYQQNQPKDVFELSAVSDQLSQIRDQYLGIVSSGTGSTPFELNQTPLEYLQSSIIAELRTENSELSYADFLRSRTLIPESMNILPAGLQFKEIAITNEYTSIPDDLKHKIKLSAISKQLSVNGGQLFEITLEARQLSNKQITITYEPETIADQETINAWGGLDNTPAYLVRLRPVLKIGDQRAVVGTDGLPMGMDFDLTIELISPKGTEKTTNSLIVGNLTVIGIIAQKAVIAPSPLAGEGGGEGAKDAARLLYEAANHYIDRWNKSEDELASLLHLAIARPIPTVVTLAGVIDVTYLLDMPHGFTWKGVYLDADVRRVETAVQSAQSGVPGDREKLFMQLSGLQGSVLEHRIFEDDWKVSAISTAKLVQLIGQLYTFDKTNIDAVLPTLALDDNIKDDIRNSVNQNLVVLMPQADGLPLTAISYLDWTGTGYRTEAPETAESGWMLSGSIAGGMTAVSPGKWDGWMFDNILSAPYQDSYKTIIITEPKDGTVLPVSSIGITGYIVDPKARVTVNGITADVEGNIFTAPVNLKSGMNKITATATNAAGKQTSDTVIVKYSIPLKTFITFPFDGAEVSVSPIFVEGLISDPTATVKVNDIIATVSSDGKFTASGISLVEGTNRITVAAVNKDGATDSQTIMVNYKVNQTPSPISVSITYPAPNAAINKPMTMVVGTVTTTANEVWVKVNGVPAVINGNQFVINNVPLVDGKNRIVADVMDNNGAIAREELNLTANTTAPYIQLSANIMSGITPMKTYLAVSSFLTDSISSYQIDYEGDGVVDYTGITFDNITHAYISDGIYSPTLTVLDSKGNSFKDSIVIVVQNKAALEAQLKEKWMSIRALLMAGNIEGAMLGFAEDSRQPYRDIFTQMGLEKINTLFMKITDLKINSLIEDVSECDALREEMRGTIAYPITFVRDENGLWKVFGF